MQIFRFSVYITFSNVISLFSVYIAFILYCFFLFFQTKVECNPFLLSLVTGPMGFPTFQFISLFPMLYHFFQFISLLFYIAFSCFFKQKVCATIFTLISHWTPMQIFQISVYITFSNVISLFSVYITFILYCFFLFFQTKVV